MVGTVDKMDIEANQKRVAAAFNVPEWEQAIARFLGDRDIVLFTGYDVEGLRIMAWWSHSAGAFYNYRVAGGPYQDAGEVDALVVEGKWRVTFRQHWSSQQAPDTPGNRHYAKSMLRALFLLEYPTVHPAYTFLEERGTFLSNHEKIEALTAYRARLEAVGESL